MRIERLILFSDIAGDVVVSDAVSLFGEARGDSVAAAVGGGNAPCGGSGGSAAVDRWVALQRALLPSVGSETVRANYWQNHICSIIAAADNPFSRAAERGAYKSLAGAEIISSGSALSESDAGLFRLAAAELDYIIEIYGAGFESIAPAPGGASAVNSAEVAQGSGDAASAGAGATRAPQSTGNIAALMASPVELSRRQRVHEALSASSGKSAAAALAAYYNSYGAGDLESCDSFYWDGGFKGVKSKDPIRLSDLIGVERQIEALKENTEFLLKGLPASNMLLYGDSGTGKSSSIKAIASEYADRGLKLVAIPKARIAELPAVLAAASGRGLKFILYIDDLSFEENESTYKSFKSVIEGGVSARPDNVIICVTSNRRNIVKEVWKDREHQDDIHIRDNLQEKRSLADRFGLTIVYSAPDKQEYLNIVTALAAKAGINMDIGELKAAALTWEVRHGGRSGRTARQFTDYLIGRRALAGGKEIKGGK
jgi:predicted AAA+ superfamily ATPase